MVLASSGRSLRLAHAIRFGLLALGGLLLGHEAVYAAQYGVGAGFAQAMVAGGHGYWPIFTTLAVSGLLLLLARAAWRLVRLRAHPDLAEVVEASAAVARVAPARSYRQEFRAIWPLLFAVVAVAFVVQENIEHYVAHGHVPGFAPLIGPDAPFALPVLAVVTLVLTALGALVRWRLNVLEARLAEVSLQRRWLAPSRDLRPAAKWPLLGAERATFWSLARQGPVRAPPPSAVA